MRTWLLITLQRYGGLKEYLGYEKKCGNSIPL